jgi:predicted acylesterase/phospholipase RssA
MFFFTAHATMYLLAKVVLIVSMVTVAGLQLGRASLKSRKVPFLPRRYRRLDGDDEVTIDGAKLPKFWNRPSNLLNQTMFVSPLSDESLPIAITEVRNTSTEMQQVLTTESLAASPAIISNVQQLRSAVLDEGRDLKDLELELKETELQVKDLCQHEVIQLILKRHREKSVPGQRSEGDRARLALAIEGGGMRGAVGGGMVAAIASLGLLDAFDVVYGSSAGSVVGAYMVSRQMCVDVYTEVLTAAQRLFVCKRRFFLNFALSAIDLFLTGFRHFVPRLDTKVIPGMNISFVLDGILDEDTGIRPLDLEAFRANDIKQPLRVASSCVRNGKLRTRCFGTRDFFNNDESAALRRADGQREGLFACLQASMTVPGAAGPPVPLFDGNETVPSFDAFCFEPLPYRSAVEEGATHVLVLRSRPQGFQPKSKPGIYELAVAPFYFRSHGEFEVADFFERGGQQYIYAEDLFTLEQGRVAGLDGRNSDGILIPPAEVLYGVKQDDDILRLASTRDVWKRAHVLPLSVPTGTPELPTVEQERDKVLEAVRGGFAVAFDLLAPAIGLDLGDDLTGRQVAELIFPSQRSNSVAILETQLRIAGHSIAICQSPPKPPRAVQWRAWLRVVELSLSRGKALRKNGNEGDTSPFELARPPMKPAVKQAHCSHVEILLSGLPGIQGGRMPGLVLGLHRSVQAAK